MRKTLNWLVTKLIKIQDVKDFLTITKTEMFVGKEKYKHSDIKGMVKDIEVIKQIPTWNIVKNTLINQAQDAIFNKSTNFDQVVNAKMILWTLKEIDNYFDTIIRKEKEYKVSEEQKKAQDSYLKGLERNNLSN